MRMSFRAAVAAAALVVTTQAGLPAQARLTSPRAQFGHEIGADYQLPDYHQLVAWWQRLARESDRMRLVDMGRTAEGRTQYMAIVSSPANLRNLEHYRQISEQLARGRVDSATAVRLAREGKAVVWIDGGLHASEVLGAQQLMETLWQLVSRNDPETLRILDDVIVLFVHANPDGMELVSDWYMRDPDPRKRSLSYLPRLYQKYVGHDDNRDFYASTQPETENMNRVMYTQWYPQIVYNHHQTGPTGTVMFAPPFRDPFNYVFDPLIPTGIDLVGAAMHTRFEAENKPGVTMRKGSNYSTWWNGGLRTTAYFHNMIGLLTETIGSPTPIEIPFVANQQLPRADLPLPIEPQTWHFRQSIDYSVTANYAVLDVASRYREQFLYRIWRMGSNAIRHGSEDHWTTYPRRLDEIRDSIAARHPQSGANAVMVPGGQVQGAPGPEESRRYLALLHRPGWRDPRGYIISADQPDFATAVKFVNALLENGIEVQRAKASFRVNGKWYPAGSLVVKTDQAFRPHVLDMFEPQDHPNDFLYPGGPPIPPYDVAGWTLAYQMDVKFDRVLDDFSGPFERVTAWNLRPPPASTAEPRWAPAGYFFSPRQNDAFTVVNRFLASGMEVSRVLSSGGRDAGLPEPEPGDFFVRPQGAASFRMMAAAESLGVDLRPVHDTHVPREMRRLRAPRIGLWDRYGGSMPSGWTRWIFEQFGFPYQRVFAPELDAGNLNAKYDVLVFVSDAIPERDRARTGGGGGGMPDPAQIPAEYRGQIGNVTVEKTVPQLRAFLENGGTIVTIGSSTVLARHLGLPVQDALVERAADGTERHLPNEKFYIPGSILRVAVDPSQPAAWGMGDHADVMFDESPVMRLGPDAEARGVHRIAWFDSDRPLRSGWAWGQQYLANGVAAAEADVGRGKLFLFGPEITFRAQPHGTFRLLFNAIYASVLDGG
ncbi:MAG TPA: M14 family zinc carboxypeptidase [Longimicrobiaceae bacterium]|nr:M14 family zinc carboxypeptidase [Longimicrobiaceae bacterium]